MVVTEQDKSDWQSYARKDIDCYWEVIIDTKLIDTSKSWLVEINTIDGAGNKSTDQILRHVDFVPTLRTINGKNYITNK